MNSSGALPQRLRASVTWQGMYAAGVFALLCFALLDLLVPLRSADLFEVYGRFLLAALFGVFLFKAGFPREWAVRLYLAYLLWLLLTRWLNRDVYLFADRELVRTELISFLMFSVGAVLSPEGRRRLLNVLSLVYAGFFVFFALPGLFVAVTNTYIHIPPENVWITMRSEGNSFSLLNLLSSFRLVTAARLYLSWALLLYQLLRTRKTGFRILLLFGMLVLHLAISLCFSRTIRICFSLSCSMLALLLGLRYLRLRSAALRALLLAAGFVLVLPLAYKSFDLCTRTLSAMLVELAPRFERRFEALETKPDMDLFGIMGSPEILAEMDEDNAEDQKDSREKAHYAEAASVSGAKFTDNRALNFSFSERTYIWESAFYVLRTRPVILLRGQTNKTLMDLPHVFMEQVYNIKRSEPHMHNYFFQTLLLTGLPGFLLVLAWTVLIVVRMIRVFFSRAASVPLHIAFLTIPMTGMFIYNQLEYELFPAWDSSTKAFLLIAGVFLGLYREYFGQRGE